MPSYRKTTAENSNLDQGNAFLEYGPDGEIGYRFWDPEHRQIVRSSDVVFNESTMHKMAERPIQVRRVIFSEVPTLHDGPTHNTRSVSRVTDIDTRCDQSSHTSKIRETVATSEELLSQEYSSPTPANRRLTKKHRQQPIQPPGIWQWSRKCTLSAPTKLGIWLTYRRIDVLFLASGSID